MMLSCICKNSRLEHLTNLVITWLVVANNRGNGSEDDSDDEDYEPEHDDSWKKVDTWLKQPNLYYNYNCGHHVTVNKYIIRIGQSITSVNLFQNTTWKTSQ